MTPVDPSRWPALSALLDEVLDLDPAARAQWLATCRREQPDLAAQLEQLLVHETRASVEHFLDPVGQETAGELLAAPETRSLGPWTLERPIGHGGMGTVWLARRRDGRFEGAAAIKFLNFALSGDEGEARFRREGTVLARLTHPNIARLLDAGVSPAGQPYLVLEYVDGTAIDAWCEARALDVPGRLALFQQVLAAVAHAHANLIVHRDVKASNILVTADGTVKLLDFGIAKLLEQAPGDEVVTTERHLSFDAAAPEQIRGEPVSTATDIYALGILLYQLLAGRHPTNEDCPTPAARARAIVEVDPLPLSRAVTAQRLRRIFAGDLDNVVAKALEKDPLRRYDTVAAFNEDLRRYTNHLPVAARQATWTYRMGKFVRRNRAAVFAGTLVWLSLIGAAVVTALQAHAARVQRDAARYQTERADAQIEFQTLLLSEVGDRPMRMSEILDRGRQLLVHQSGGDPRFLPSILVDLSDRYGEIGDRQVRDTLLRQADSIATSLGATSLKALVRCDRVDELRSEGKYDEARATIAAAESLLQRAPDPTVEVLCLQVRGELQVETGDGDHGVTPLRNALAIMMRSGQTHEAQYFGLLNDLASALDQSGRPREALATYARAMAGMDSSGRGGMLSRTIIEHDAAVVLAKLGETDAAERMFHEVLLRAAAADANGRIDWQPLIHYAETALTQRHADSASKYFGMIVRRAVAESSLYWQGRGLYGLVRAQIALGQIEEARASTARFVRAARVFPGIKATDDVVPDSIALDGLVTLATGHPAVAQASFLAALRANGYYEGKRRTRLRPLVLLVAQTALELGQPDTALVYARAAETSTPVDSLAAARSEWIGEARLLEARAFLATGDTARARPLATAAASALDAGAGPGHPVTLAARALVDSLTRR
ncbi:MAG TPA: serine/threonine-protein kinase [Gemmatimonadales bacterium]|nr:serine/threonine-protein kinase [Gemmatimonadales bacterium]